MKRINPRLAKKHRSYSVQELAEKLGVHKHTVRGWLAKGLPNVDSAKPALILGSEFQEWWGKQLKAAKRPCRPGQLYCFKCREPKAPALGMVEYAATNAATGNLRALCDTCGTMMHRRTRLADLARIMPGLDVRRTGPASSIEERVHPSSNTDNLAGA
jgi:predicted ArsR family transcriptional regulator